ncbi:alpha/beta fold hydrolase [Robiginitalea sp. IMCC44478]|uniref:alpha/beta fold hydrolase n=1 Tax=Robiginitalea sp. IMCC44478 TaxID=3459122 RepID=UPI0040418BBC
MALICNFSITGCKTGDVEKSYFSSSDGTKIAYTDEGRGNPVLLIHGFIVDGNFNWGNSEFRKQLLNEGYRVFIPDLRGNGNSDKPQNKESYKDNAEVKDLIALADHLGLKNYMAVWYSRGSIILAKLLTMKIPGIYKGKYPVAG